MLDIKALLNKLTTHYNNVGDVQSGSKTSITLTNSSSWQSLGINATIPAGSWIIMADVRFGSKANTSYRSVRINVDGDTYAGTHYVAGSGETAIVVSTVTKNKTSSWTLDFMARQYSSSSTTSITVSCYWRAMRVK